MAGRGDLRVVLLGAPGSGKGTQAERLSAVLGIPCISTGDMLRQAVAEGTELGARVKSVMAAGELVADDLMAAVVRERLARPDAASGFLIDGFPRTPEQARTLDSILAAAGESLDAVLLLEVPEPVLIERALARRRADDQREVVLERLRVYRQKTEPLVEHYERRGLLRRVDGDRAIEPITGSLLAELGQG